MNQDQITGIIRAVVPPAVTWLAAKGYLSAGSTDSIVSALIAIVAAVGAAGWSVHNNQTGKVIGQ